MENRLSKYDPVKLGEQLQHARKSVNLTQSDVAKKLDVSRTTITAIENGTRKVSPEEFVKMIRIYNKNVNDILDGVEFDFRPFHVQFRSVWKEHKKYSNEIENIILTFEKYCRNQFKLEQLLGTPLHKHYPAQYLVKSSDIEFEAENIANAERARLGIGSAPVKNLRDVLELEVGLRIFFLKMPAPVSEIYTYDEKLGGCMAINSDHPPGRQRWSMGHGYAHFLMHRHDKIVDVINDKAKSKNEYLADAFSKYFIMPTEGIKRVYRKRDNDGFQVADLFTMAYQFGVSINAICRRLEEMGLVKKGTLELIMKSGHKIGDIWNDQNLPEIQENRDVFPQHYKNMLCEAWLKSAITEEQLADYLGLDRVDARAYIAKLIDQDRGYQTKVDQLDYGGYG